MAGPDCDFAPGREFATVDAYRAARSAAVQSLIAAAQEFAPPRGLSYSGRWHGLSVHNYHFQHYPEEGMSFAVLQLSDDEGAVVAVKVLAEDFLGGVFAALIPVGAAEKVYALGAPLPRARLTQEPCGAVIAAAEYSEGVVHRGLLVALPLTKSVEAFRAKAALDELRRRAGAAAWSGSSSDAGSDTESA